MFSTGLPFYGWQSHLFQHQRGQPTRQAQEIFLGFSLQHVQTGFSLQHVQTVALVLLLSTGLTLPQFHVQCDNAFQGEFWEILHQCPNGSTSVGFQQDGQKCPQTKVLMREQLCHKEQGCSKSTYQPMWGTTPTQGIPPGMYHWSTNCWGTLRWTNVPTRQQGT